MVLGGSNKLSHHLIAHPEHLELLETELVKVPADSLRRELLRGDRRGPGIADAHRNGPHR